MSTVLTYAPLAVCAYAIWRLGWHRRAMKVRPHKHGAAALVGSGVVLAIGAVLALHIVEAALPLAVLAVLADLAWKHRRTVGPKVASLWARIHSGGLFG